VSHTFHPAWKTSPGHLWLRRGLTRGVRKRARHNCLKFTVVTLCAQLTRDLLAIATFLVRKGVVSNTACDKCPELYQPNWRVLYSTVMARKIRRKQSLTASKALNRSLAVAERLRDASCLSVVSFNSTILRAQSFIIRLQIYHCVQLNSVLLASA